MREVVDRLRLPPSYKEKIIRAVNACIESKDILDFKEIRLFGSCSREEVRFGSDIDILLVGRYKRTRQQQECLLKLEEELEEGRPELELVLRSWECLSDMTQIFNRNIAKDSILLYEEV